MRPRVENPSDNGYRPFRDGSIEMNDPGRNFIWTAQSNLICTAGNRTGRIRLNLGKPIFFSGYR